MKSCIYCGIKKFEDSFSDEHIWPSALGGDFLPRDVWRTDDVCQDCNSMSGVYVDADFIRSWFGKSELSRNSLEYLARRGKVSPIPPDFFGRIQNVPIPSGHVAEYWAGPCGANIIHIRPDNGNEQWTVYAGGDPRTRKSKAGRAYMALTSEEPFWVAVSLETLRTYFSLAERYIINMDVSPEWPFKNPDKNNPLQAEDMKTVEAFIKTIQSGTPINISYQVRLDFGNRMLAKLGLGVGYKLLGPEFPNTDYAKILRRYFREGNAEKRKTIPVRGSGYLTGSGLVGMETLMAWPGGWGLMVNVVEGSLSLSIISPSGRAMTVLVCDDPLLVSKLDASYRNGVIWVTVPAAQTAVGPIPLSEYIEHQTNNRAHPVLTALADRRGDPKTLPQCSSIPSHGWIASRAPE